MTKEIYFQLILNLLIQMRILLSGRKNVISVSSLVQNYHKNGFTQQWNCIQIQKLVEMKKFKENFIEQNRY